MSRERDRIFRKSCLGIMAFLAWFPLWIGPRAPRAETSIREVPPLEISYAVIAQRRMTDGTFQDVPVRDGAVLHSHDYLKITFRTNEDCYVYVLLLDSRGKASKLFPHRGIPLGNRVQGGRDYEIPSEEQWFWLDEQTGTETLYLLASYEHMLGIDKLLREMEQAGAASYEVVARGIQKEVEILTRGSDRFKKRPKKPIYITGSVGRSEQLRITTRGVEGKALAEESHSFKLSDGKTIQKVTRVVRGYASCVEAIRFEHR